MRSVKTEVPAANPQGYADDVGITSSNPNDILQTCVLTEEFSAHTGTRANAGKSHVWATQLAHREILADQSIIGGKKLTLVSEDRRLGAHLSYNGRRAQTTFKKKNLQNA